MSMNTNNRHEQTGSQVNEKIDHSLSLLKQLETKLHNDKNNYVSFNKNVYESPSGHTRMRTEPYSFSQRNNINNNYETTQFTITEKSEEQPRNASPIPNTFSHSQPTMIEHNQNDHSSIKDIIKENRKLKKYVNCLLQMNDYLKNQLVKKDTLVGVNNLGHSFELELMKMEIQYLKQLNRDKELQLRKSQHFGHHSQIRQKKNPKIKDCKGVPSQQPPAKRSHGRSSSAYEVFEQTSNYSKVHPKCIDNQQENTEPYDQIASQRILKTKQPKKVSCKTPYKKVTCNGQCKNCRQKIASTKDQCKKRKLTKKVDNSQVKCRLCYF